MTLTAQLAVQKLKGEPIPESIFEMIERVSQHTGVSVDDILSDSRVAKTAHARHLAMHLARRFLGSSLPQIGRAFNQHHTTVLYALRKEIA